MTQLRLHGMHPESVWLNLSHYCPDGMDTMHAVVQSDFNGDTPVCTVFFNGLPVMITDEVGRVADKVAYGGETHIIVTGMPGHGESAVNFKINIGVFSLHMVEDPNYDQMYAEICAKPWETLNILASATWLENYVDDGHALCGFLDELTERYEAALAR